jgi:hypothetical protein
LEKLVIISSVACRSIQSCRCSNSQICSLRAEGYTFSLLAALLTVGGLSDYVGRRPVILGGLLLNAIAMVLFSYATDCM